MIALCRKLLSLTLILLVVILTPGSAVSDHIVTPNDLQNAITNHSIQREANIQRVTQFLSSPAALEAMNRMKVDPVKITKGVTMLSDEELANLTSRVDTAETQFAAGYHMEHEIITLLIIIILVIAIVVIVQQVD